MLETVQQLDSSAQNSRCKNYRAIFLQMASAACNMPHYRGENMRFIAIYLSAFMLILLSSTHASGLSYERSLLEYFGSDNEEAQIEIAGYVVLNVVPNQATSQTTTPTRAQIDPVIALQMRYMLGVMRSRATQAAALYPKWSYTVTEIKALAPEGYTQSYLVKYNLKTKGLFALNMKQYTFTLPINPKKIFSQAKGKCSVKPAEEASFWYHWEPLTRGCPLKENVEYFTYNSKLKTLKNTVESYPEYDKLPDLFKLIKMTMLFGFENYGQQQWTLDGNDWGIKGFNQQRKFLKNLGYSETIWSRKQIDALYRLKAKSKDRFIPYISEFTFVGAIASIRIRLVLADSGFNHNSTAFHLILKESLAKESVIVYNGHAGLGKNLDLSSIEKLRNFKFSFNPNYQILFLGSCIPYSYYTEMFFSRKTTAADPQGSLNLDILSYGKEAIFSNVEDQVLTKALTKYARSGEKQSYQTIIKSSPNYFFGVNGDEDNAK